MLQPAPGIEEKAGSEHQRRHDDVADACCREQPETVNGAQNRDQPGFEGHVVLTQAIVVNGYFQAIKRGKDERDHDRAGRQGVHGLIGGRLKVYDDQQDLYHGCSQQQSSNGRSLAVFSGEKFREAAV